MPLTVDISSEDISRLCKRFRVLIIGRRNAGKTTILEKMTGSDVGAKPVIRDKEGRLVVRAPLIYLNIDSQADGYRMTRHLSRPGWRSVESIGTSIYSPTPLTKIPARDERDRLRDNIPE
jgi:GTPase SAR1 family protein